METYQVAKVNTPKEQAIEAIDEYLIAARACIDTRKPDGGILGYPAALLLLCATDAIGHGVLQPKNGQHTRLDVLKQSPFNLHLTDGQVGNITRWYRHLLAHNGTIAVGVFMEPDTQGQPFDFDRSGAPMLIRVPVFYGIVEGAWQRQDKTAFNPPPATGAQPDPSARPAAFFSTLSPAASGVV